MMILVRALPVGVMRIEREKQILVSNAERRCEKVLRPAPAWGLLPLTVILKDDSIEHAPPSELPPEFDGEQRVKSSQFVLWQVLHFSSALVPQCLLWIHVFLIPIFVALFSCAAMTSALWFPLFVRLVCWIRKLRSASLHLHDIHLVFCLGYSCGVSFLPISLALVTLATTVFHLVQNKTMLRDYIPA